MSNIGIITNPHAKLNKNNPHRQKKLEQLTYEKAHLRITKNLEAVELVAKEFYHKNIDILAIDGGDGTISRTLSVFINVFKNKPLPHLAILGGGTINVLADNLGIKNSPENILNSLIHKKAAAKTFNYKELNCLKIENNYGFLFANGICSNFLKMFYEKKTDSLGAIFLALKIFFSKLKNGKTFKKIESFEHTKLSFDDFPELSHFTSAVLCSTLEKITLAIPFFPKELNNNKQFQCVSVTTPPKDLVFKYILPILFSVKNQKKKSLCFSCNTLRIEEEKPFMYTIDGELYTSTKKQLTIKLGPKIKFILQRT